ncbi:MAG: nucleotidyl transferase AbiEii/AbiGii toxin family protein [Muribaculaceae bacterium]|nr:nucleotidyl transferase AbiEii/AbiGii toxin family protein [Muribaculaceae bacterium]
MIDPESRTIEWINEIHSKHNKLDKSLIEKSIRAFSLLESLALSGCPFIFKGGTCVMLHLDSSRRISVDIDIICPPGTDLTSFIEKHSAEYGFTGVKLIERKGRNDVPKSHAKFFYKISYRTNADEGNILLDVLFEDIHYSRIESLPIRSRFLKTIGDDVYVRVPSIEDILGDKLTAFAPHTTGMPYYTYYKGDNPAFLEVIKQMYDIATLSDRIKDLALVKETFMKFVKVELGYRNIEGMSAEDVLKDTIDTALTLSLRGVVNKEEFDKLQSGVKRIDGFIVSGRYLLDSAIKDAAKAAYVAALIMSGETEITSYSWEATKVLPGMTNLHTKLNKLKKTNPEAFYYWSMVDRLLITN